jgi:hypothetical protein
MNSDINWAILIRTCHGYIEIFDVFLNLLARSGLRIGLVDHGKITTMSSEFENKPSSGQIKPSPATRTLPDTFISLQFVPE